MTIAPRVSLITLAVGDVVTSRRFYEALGWRASSASRNEVAFFDCGGTILALYGREDLAADTGQSLPPAGPSITLAYNVGTEDEVGAVVAAMLAAGATLVRPARRADWGGNVAYVADPDGHVWEIAHNPVWPLGPDGRMALPPPAE